MDLMEHLTSVSAFQIIGTQRLSDQVERSESMDHTLKHIIDIRRGFEELIPWLTLRLQRCFDLTRCGLVAQEIAESLERDGNGVLWSALSRIPMQPADVVRRAAVQTACEIGCLTMDGIPETIIIDGVIDYIRNEVLGIVQQHLYYNVLPSHHGPTAAAQICAIYFDMSLDFEAKLRLKAQDCRAKCA